jgi:hypothetical protein
MPVGESGLREEENLCRWKRTSLVRRLLEEKIEGNLDAVNKLLAPDFVDFFERSLLPDQQLSREEYKRSMIGLTFDSQI